MIAVGFMCFGAALSVLSAVLTTFSIQHLSTTDLHKLFPKHTLAQLPSDRHALITSTWFSSGLLYTALWLAIAYFAYRGLPWIRIVATALFAMNTMNTVLLFIAGPAVGNLLYITAVWLAGLGATLPLWLPVSNPYLRPVARPA